MKRFGIIVLMGSLATAGVGCGDDSSATLDAGTNPDASASGDAAGNPDAMPADTTPPGAPTALTAVYNTGTGAVDLAWTNPSDADLAGVLIIRAVGGPVSDMPTDGTSYAVNDILADGGRVIHAGPGATAVDAVPASGENIYWAWAYDAVPNYSTGHADATITLSSLSIDVTNLASPTVTVISHPNGYQMTAAVRLRPATFLLGGSEEGEMVFAATAAGAAGNGATISLVDGGDGASLTVATVGTAVEITFDQFTHSTKQIAAAINGDTSASAIMTATAAFDSLRINEMDGAVLTGGADDALRVWVTGTNIGTRPVFNPKFIVDSVSAGTPASRWTLESSAFAYLSYSGLDLAATGTGWFDLEALTASPTPINIDLIGRDDPSVIISGRWNHSFVAADSSGAGPEIAISSEALGYLGFDNDSRHRDGFITPNGRTMYLANHNNPNVVGIDLMTFRPTIAVDLDDATGIGFVDSVVAAPANDYMYAVVTHGAHGAAWQAPGASANAICNGTATCLSAAETVELVKISLADLSIAGRVTVHSASANGARGRKLSISSDGTKGSMAIFREGKVAVIDLAAMTVLQTVDTSTSGNMLPVFAAISPDGTKTYVGFKAYAFDGGIPADQTNDGTLQVINHSDWSMSPLAPPALADGNKIGFLEFGPDGRLYYGRKQGVTATDTLSIYTPSTTTWKTLDIGAVKVNGMEFSPDGSILYLFNGQNGSISVIVPTTDTILATFTASRLSGFGHKTLVTPY